MSIYLPAEWAPQSAVQFTFPHEDSDWKDDLPEVIPCFVECIEAVARYQKVLVVCREVEEVQAFLKDIPGERLLLVEAPSNDTWARDHGGITIFQNGQPVLLDFIFNGWGLKFPADRDNLITGILYQQGIFSVSRLQPGGMVLEGGGIESDGQGTLLTTASCMLSPNRNPHWDQQEIEDRLKELFGLDRVLWLYHGYLAGDDTDAHIDTLARFCDAQTIAYVQCTDPNDEHFEALCQMEKELQTFKTIDGKSYRLIPLPMPTACFDNEGHRLPATYANFLIINGAVLLPIYGVPEDDLAVAQLKTCFPNRQIIPINCRSLIEQHGSLHCISMQYPEGVIR